MKVNTGSLMYKDNEGNVGILRSLSDNDLTKLKKALTTINQLVGSTASLEDALAKEIADRTNGDNSLNDALAKEVSTRASEDNAIKASIPTKVSQLENDAGYLTTDANTTYTAAYPLDLTDNTFSLNEVTTVGTYVISAQNTPSYLDGNTLVLQFPTIIIDKWGRIVAKSSSYQKIDLSSIASGSAQEDAVATVSVTYDATNDRIAFGDSSIGEQSALGVSIIGPASSSTDYVLQTLLAWIKAHVDANAVRVTSYSPGGHIGWNGCSGGGSATFISTITYDTTTGA